VKGKEKSLYHAIKFADCTEIASPSKLTERRSQRIVRCADFRYKKPAISLKRGLDRAKRKMSGGGFATRPAEAKGTPKGTAKFMSFSNFQRCPGDETVGGPS